MEFYDNEIVIKGTCVLDNDYYYKMQKVVLHISVEDIVEAIKQVQERTQEKLDEENKE